MHRRHALVAVAVASAAALSVPAQAAPHPVLARPHTIAAGLVGPLSFAVTGKPGDRTFYVSQDFAGLLSKVRPGHRPATVLAAKAGVEAVSALGRRVTFAEGRVLAVRTPDGRVHEIANLGAFEKRHNPDHRFLDGTTGLSRKCAAAVPPHLALEHGGVDAHPYGTVITRRATYVADAGANTIWKVTAGGRVRTLAVFAPIAERITSQWAAAAAGEGATVPACAMGHTYLAQAVPTDVEMGPDHMLYVSLLPGGVEGPVGRGYGQVWRVDPRSGHATMVAKGLYGATGVAVTRNGDIYVAEMFANRISVLHDGRRRVFAHVDTPAAVEVAGRRLYFTSHAVPDGSGPPNGQLKSAAIG